MKTRITKSRTNDISPQKGSATNSINPPPYGLQMADHRIHFSGNAPIQQKTLSDAGLDRDLEKTTQHRETVGQHRLQGIIYNDNVLSPGKTGRNKTEALQIAAKENATVGERVDTWGTDNKQEILSSTGGKWQPGKIFTTTPGELNKEETPTLDPFFLFTTVRYDSGRDTNFLHLIFQHTSDYSGYIESISDSSNPHTSDFISMYSGTKDRGDRQDRRPRYSNQHAQDTEGPLIDQTSGGSESDFDAYTKIAGEGARWQCVREHAPYLEDNSFFYTALSAKKKDHVRALRFSDLWVSWKDVFKKKYNIPDSEVRKKIGNPKLKLNAKVEEMAFYEMGQEDYDLDEQ